MSTIDFEYASSLANIDFGSVGCKPESEGKVKLQGYLHLSLVQIPATPPLPRIAKHFLNAVVEETLSSKDF
jgi:hypothetical protein